MKRILLLVGAMLFLVCNPLDTQAESPDRGPENINLKMGNMDLLFHHWKHQTDVHNDCFNCHKTKIGQIDNWGETSAHRICIPCHELESKGPVLCRECHTK